MSTYQLFGDRWEGRVDREWRVVSPSEHDLDQAIERLDGTTYTMISLERLGEGEQHLAVGGGGGRYVVYATFDNEEFWNLVCSEPAEGVVLVKAGGQEGEYPARNVVNLAQARSAGRAFLNSGELDRGQEWEKRE